MNRKLFMKMGYTMNNKIKKICLICQIEFYIPPSREKRNGGKYCSNACHWESKKLPLVERKCINCNKVFHVWPSRAATAQFCSKACKAFDMFKNKPYPDPIKRFLEKVIKLENGCWQYKAVDPRGYGYFDIKYKRLRAHRYSFMIHHGKIPPGMVICHKCDNPSCVNPEHLFLGTQLDNMRDKMQKGRHKTRKRKDAV